MGVNPGAALKPYTVAIGRSPDGGWPLPWLESAAQAAMALRQAHALLLVGPAGVGHLELALLLAQGTLCERPAPDGLPCGHCESCHLVRQRSHPDLMLLLPDALRVQLGWLGDDEGKLAKAEAKPSKEVKVAQVREAIAWGQQTNARGRGKVLVVHPADALNLIAANALLKTLEEPPGTLRLLLTSADAERLLPTVRSRCQRVALGLPPRAVANAWLRLHGLPEPDAVLDLAGGSPLDALAWAEEGMGAQWLSDLPRHVANGDSSLLAGRPVPRVVDLLLKLAHDAMAVAVGGVPCFFPSDCLAAGADLAALLAWQRDLLRVARHEDHPWNAGLLIESLVTQGARAWPRPSAAGRREGATGGSGASRGGGPGRAGYGRAS